jgi:hypothetical protein
MNRFISAALMLAMLATNPAAYADGWHGNGNHDDDHGHGSWHNPGYHPAPVRPYYPYYPYPQHKNNNNHTEWPAYLVGGLVLGALLTNAFPGSRPAQYADNVPSSPPGLQGRRLFRDANGNCYERRTDSAGNELSTELPASACDW